MRRATCKWSNIKQIWFLVLHILVCNYGVISLGVKGERLHKGHTTIIESLTFPERKSRCVSGS